MSVDSIPWDKPLGVVFAIVLVGIFIDLTYRKIPRGFTRIRFELKRQTNSIDKQQNDNRNLLNAVLVSIERLDTAIATLLERLEAQEASRGSREPRPKKKSKRPSVLKK